MVPISQGFSLFWSLLLSALPFLGIGILISSAIQIWGIPSQWLRRWPHHPIVAAGCGSGLGFVFPTGPYGQIPVARSLLMAGVPTASVISYLIAAPSLNFWVLVLMGLTFPHQPELFWLRGSFIGVASLLIGGLFGVLTKGTSPETADVPGTKSKSTAIATAVLLRAVTEQRSSSVPEAPIEKPFLSRRPTQFKRFLNTTLNEGKAYGTMLVLSCAVVATLQMKFSALQFIAVPQTTITPLLMAPLLSLGSLGDTLFASTLGSVMPLKNLLTFWLMGSIVDLKSLGLLYVAFQPKIVIYLAILISQLTLLSTLLFAFQNA